MTNCLDEHFSFREKKKKHFVHKLTINYSACYWMMVITSYTWTVFNAYNSFFYLFTFIPSTLDYVNFTDTSKNTSIRRSYLIKNIEQLRQKEHAKDDFRLHKNISHSSCIEKCKWIPNSFKNGANLYESISSPDEI